MRVTFVKDRSFRTTKKQKNQKHFNFRSTKIRGTNAAKKLATNQRTLARVSALHKATCRTLRATKKTADAQAK